jgi:hypothetical protein
MNCEYDEFGPIDTKTGLSVSMQEKYANEPSPKTSNSVKNISDGSQECVGERYNAKMEKSSKKLAYAHKPRKYEDLGDGWRRVTYARRSQPSKVAAAE